MADTLKTQGMSLLQATRLAADRQLYLPVTPTGNLQAEEKSKSKDVQSGRSACERVDGSCVYGRDTVIFLSLWYRAEIAISDHLCISARFCPYHVSWRRS